MPPNQTPTPPSVWRGWIASGVIIAILALGVAATYMSEAWLVLWRMRFHEQLLIVATGAFVVATSFTIMVFGWDAMRLSKSVAVWWGICMALLSYWMIWLAWEYTDSFANANNSVPVGRVYVRNPVLTVFTPLGVGVAVWRSVLAILQIRLDESGLLQDRYQAAANMLGSDSMATRIGGIAILAEIAKDHSDEYHIRVMEILAAFIRHLSIKNEDPNNILTAIRAISARNQQQKNAEKKHKQRQPDWRINLTGALVAGVQLPEGDLSHVNLSRADLRNANLANANLSHADFTEADLTGANWQGANLTGAKGIKQ